MSFQKTSKNRSGKLGMRNNKVQLTTNKVIFVLSVTFLLYGCATTQVSNNVEIPDWETEQKRAVPHFIANEISSEEYSFERSINGRDEQFGYIGRLYNIPIYITDKYFTELPKRELRITEFPREGTRPSIIMWTCINNFRKRTKARPGEYFCLFIMTSEYIGGSVDMTMILYGRFENNGFIRGSIRRSI